MGSHQGAGWRRPIPALRTCSTIPWEPPGGWTWTSCSACVTFAKMRQRLDTVADIFMVQNILLGLETGQETAQELAALLHKLNHPNIGVNFDPANMLMYDKGDPVKALHSLAPWIRQVHIKDAKRAKTPGTWGEETIVGKGEVDWRGFFTTFKHVVFNVNLVIEREFGGTRAADIRAAHDFIRKTFT